MHLSLPTATSSFSYLLPIPVFRLSALSLKGRKNMSYQHVHHSSQGFGGPFPSAVPPPPGFPTSAPPPPPPPVPGYQGYFNEGYNQPPPPPIYEHHHQQDDFRANCWSLWRGCCAALCCCCVLEECCL